MGSLPTDSSILINNNSISNYGVAAYKNRDMIAFDQGGLNRLCSTRYSITYMAFFGLFIAFVLKINLSTAIVAMANHTQTDRHVIDPCFPQPTDGVTSTTVPVPLTTSSHYIRTSPSGISNGTTEGITTYHSGDMNTTKTPNTTTDPMLSTTDTASSNTDPVSSNTDPVSSNTDPVSSNTGPMSSNTDTASSNTDPVSSNTDHVSPSTGGVLRGLKTAVPKTRTFDWDSKERGFILASFFFGYILTQLPAGILASVFGPKRVVGGGIFVASIMTLVTPISAEYSSYMLIACRIGVGLGLGVVYPAFHEMWSRWAPPMERTQMISIASAGAYIGAVVTPPLVGFLCDCGFAGGWCAAFYITGGMGLVWCVFWALLVFDRPSNHPRISMEEKIYLLTHLKHHHHNDESLNIPWVQILTSPQFWSIAIAHFATQWGMNLILICLPTYFTDILSFNTATTGLYAAIPYIAYTVIMLTTSVVADNLRRVKLLTTTRVRKLFQSLGNALPAVLLFLVHYSGCSTTTPVILLTLAVGCMGFTMAGYHPNHVDIAPKYAGILMGITNMLANTTGFIAPMLVGALTSGNDLRHQWDTIFDICSAVCLVGMVVYAVGGSGERIWWSEGVTGKKLRLEQDRLEKSDFGQSSHASLILSLSFSPPGI